jgi:hypothetical protein
MTSAGAALPSGRNYQFRPNQHKDWQMADLALFFYQIMSLHNPYKKMSKFIKIL